MDEGVFFFSADGRLLVRPTETGEIHEATKSDRHDVGQALRIPWPHWRGWLGVDDGPRDPT